MGQHGNHRNSEFRSDFQRLNIVLLFVATVIPVALFVGAWRRVPQTGERTASRIGSASAPRQEARIKSMPLVNTALQPSRIFPYSVIPGGAHSEAELKNALVHDPVAAAHYAGFDVARTHVIRLGHAEKVYVSYRIGDRIYWTWRRLYIPAGEPVLSDGEHEARTRCGNRLSETPQLPVSAREPSREVLNGPAVVTPAPTVNETPPASALVQPELGLREIAVLDPVDVRTFGPPPLIPIAGGPGVSPLPPSQNPPPTGPQPPPPSDPQPPAGPPSGPPQPIAATPEPPSVLLFLLSAGVLGVVAWRRRVLN